MPKDKAKTGLPQSKKLPLVGLSDVAGFMLLGQGTNTDRYITAIAVANPDCFISLDEVADLIEEICVEDAGDSPGLVHGVYSSMLTVREMIRQTTIALKKFHEKGELEQWQKPEEVGH